ncbi:MAG: YraN family protein [Acetivibrionales bacterium]|jgi:putative endonuclease
MNKRKYGIAGENAAVDYLAKNGFIILERNFRPGKLGEIDIIARESEYICFIEVKTRTSRLFGTPAEAVGRVKREKLKKLAWIYIKQMNLGERNMRFDVVEVFGSISGEDFIPAQINLIRSAF